MKRRMRFALWLYPTEWRGRYAREFEALLEDVDCGWRECWDVARGGLKMRLLRWNLANVTIACALVGMVVGAGWALRLPDRYTATAVLKPAPTPKSGFVNLDLARIIEDENLYAEQRATMPMKDVLICMRQDLRVDRGAAGITVHYQHKDPAKAQRVAQAVAERYLASGGIEVVQQPTLPDRPEGPNRLAFTLIGLAVGTVAGILAVGIRRWPVVAAAGFATAAAALAIAFAIPDQWVSTAVLKIDPVSPTLAQTVLDDAVLQRIVEKRAMNLYPDERAKQPMSEILRRMRERDLIVRDTPQGIAVTFRYPDRYKAQAAVREFVTTLTEWNIVEARKKGFARQTMSVIEPANLPAAPSRPNRLAILLAGLAAGLTGGIYLTWKRQSRTLAAGA